MNFLIKLILPNFVLRAVLDYRHKIKCKKLENLTSKEAFEKVYAEGLWGRSAHLGERFYSGSGSHTENIVSIYVDAIEKYLNSHDSRFDVVDLGCGDFAVGSKIRNFCGSYVACDVVESLISQNKIRYKDMNVDFRVVDIVADELPFGEIAFVRQVLQHLPNKLIAPILSKISNKYKYLILTEHLPTGNEFIPNLDIPVGEGIRLGLGNTGSGVVITAPPFNFKVKSEAVLCEVNESGGVIRTIAYEL